MIYELFPPAGTASAVPVLPHTRGESGAEAKKQAIFLPFAV